MAADADLGEDLGGVDDLDLDRDAVTGVELLATDLACRLTCPLGGVIDDPEYGEDLRLYLNDEASPRTLATIQAKVLKQVRLDERVENVVSVTPSFSGVGDERTLSVDVDGETADGPFSLTIAVDKARTTVLEGVAR